MNVVLLLAKADFCSVRALIKIPMTDGGDLVRRKNDVNQVEEMGRMRDIIGNIVINKKTYICSWSKVWLAI